MGEEGGEGFQGFLSSEPAVEDWTWRDLYCTACRPQQVADMQGTSREPASLPPCATHLFFAGQHPACIVKSIQKATKDAGLWS